jgi:hypothetical protein
MLRNTKQFYKWLFTAPDASFRVIGYRLEKPSLNIIFQIEPTPTS